MIYETLQILREQLDNYIDRETSLGKIVILDNVAMLESGSENSDKLAGKVVLTLLNIEEENTMKNISAVRVVNNKTEYRNPPVHLNLHFLVSANCDSYDNSLTAISKTIEYFQAKRLFTSSNTIFDKAKIPTSILDYFRFVVELYTPSFEILNHIWGTLGGRQLPSAIYRVQLIQIERDKKLATSEVITHIDGTLNDIN